MLDIKLIRENPKVVKENLKKRGREREVSLVEDLIKYDREWRKKLEEVNKLRNRRNILTREISELKKTGEDFSGKLKEVKEIPGKIKDLEIKVEKLKEECNRILMSLPNLIHESVPAGKSEEDNVVIKVVGKPPKFDFEPKNHVDLLSSLNLMDGERAAKVSGTGFFYNKGSLVLLDLALIKYAIDFLRKRGYIPINTPYMLRRKPYEGVVDLGDFEEVMYKIENEDLYLIATSEHPIASMFMNETLNNENLPFKFAGISPCFRKEIGAHGKYTKGLFRMHQFHKVEQFIFSHPEDSWKYFEEIQRNAEKLYEGLGLAYRVVNVCSGELSGVASKRFDIEIWMADGKYREVGSNSNCLDYQARRLGIKFREGEGKPPKGFVHTLNNTALATSRTMIGIVEQYQQEDGSIKIPRVLRPYMDGKSRIESL